MPDYQANGAISSDFRSIARDRRLRVTFERSSDFLEIADDYAATPLVRWVALDSKLGIGRVYVKYENGRFGLDSFKSLGALNAVAKLELSGDSTLACATAGNHGCGVALAARRAGLRSVVYLKGSAHDRRAGVLESLGAQVVCLESTFDDVYRHLLEAAEKDKRWVIVQDTSPDPDDEILWNIIRGYSIVTLEVVEALTDANERPSHFFAQSGAGAFATSVVMGLAKAYGRDAPSLILAEPESAACFAASFRTGAPVTVPADQVSTMRRLDVGTCAAAAWNLLSQVAAGSMSVTDAEAEAAAELWVSAGPPELGRAATPSGAAGLAALIGACNARQTRETLRLDADSVVVLYLSETSN